MNKKDNMGRSLRLLLIDDNPDDRALTLRELKKEFEIQVQEIIDAEGFASALKEGDFDIAITDYQLKWSNGLEILGKIKTHYPDCPVIMFTGTGNEEIAVEAMKHSLDDYVIKSSKHFKRLPAAMKAAIKKAKERQAMRETQEALRESEAQKRAILDVSIDRIRLSDRDMRIIWANETHARELNIAPEDIIGKYCYEFFFGKDAPCDGCPAQEAIRTGKTEHSVLVRPQPEIEGGKTYLDTYAVPIKNESGDIVNIIQITRDITARKQAEEQLTASLKEKELLLQEIHHRVKNNMQVISSLLKLQAETMENERLKEAFRDSQSRVRTMSLVHEKLYQSKDFTHVPFKDYLTSLIRYLSQSYTSQAREIEFVTEIEEIPLSITHAIPCGLIINELVSNALKHAFPDTRTGTITISLRSLRKDTIELSVGDNGIGLPEAIDPHTTTFLGLHLVAILAKDQLKGEITMEREGGTRVRITFKVG